MKRILEILTYINSGGAEMVVYNYLSHMDRDGLQFDVLALEQPFKPMLEEKFRELGVKVYYLPTSIMKRFSVFEKLMKNNHYDVVHAHSEFLCEIYMAIAARYGVKTRIMHSHMAGGHYSLAKSLYAPLAKMIARHTATHYFGCGVDACRSQWGDRLYKAGKCFVLNNAIDIERFTFDEATRAEVRKKMGWNGKYVIINVGRFVEQKNHTFLIDVYKALTEKHNDTILVLVGEGPLMNGIKGKVSDLGLIDNVQFLGRRNDVSRLLNGADVFFLPSLFEGFPVVSIETQTNGLPIVMSEGVTKESDITNLSSFVSFASPMDDWISALMKESYRDRKIYADKVRDKNYDLNVEAAKLRQFYLDN